MDKALRRLKKKIDREGTLRVVRSHRHYEKPSEKRRRKDENDRHPSAYEEEGHAGVDEEASQEDWEETSHCRNGDQESFSEILRHEEENQAGEVRSQARALSGFRLPGAVGRSKGGEV